MTALRQFGFAHIPPQLARTGSLGWASFRVGEHLLVEGVAVRRTRDGSFPAGVDAGGRERHCVWPVCDRARPELERAVLSQLGPEVAP